jgi:hypothetical protein
MLEIVLLYTDQLSPICALSVKAYKNAEGKEIDIEDLAKIILKIRRFSNKVDESLMRERLYYGDDQVLARRPPSTGDKRRLGILCRNWKRR